MDKKNYSIYTASIGRYGIKMEFESNWGKQHERQQDSKKTKKIKVSKKAVRQLVKRIMLIKSTKQIGTLR